MNIKTKKHDPNNPNPWFALALDNSTFLEHDVKLALMKNNENWSRRVLLPILRVWGRLAIVIIRFFRLFIPTIFTSSKFLHHTICWGMKNFVSPEANYLILRHFNIGSQVLAFLNTNIAKGTLNAVPLYPQHIIDLKDNVFVQHDLNIFNFIIELNQYLSEANLEIEAKDIPELDFSNIKTLALSQSDMPDQWHNFLDLQSAIELYTPLFALFLSREDFERASNSLQLDETIAIYTAKLFNRAELMGIVNNKHPFIPLSPVQAGIRLMLHGIDAENLHGFISSYK